jgi:hypothetical protein
MDQKVKQRRFLKHLWLLHTLKKFIYSHLLRPGSEPDPDPVLDARIRIRPKRSGSDRIRIRNTAGYYKAKIKNKCSVYLQYVDPVHQWLEEPTVVLNKLTRTK